MSYQLHDDIIRTGTITSIGSRVKIKESVTYIFHLVPLNKVRHLRFQFHLRY